MKKKLIRYTKIFICIILIFSFAIASFAANSAENGNSFITKEEFEKAFNDFDKRLTSFEAGINAKIDTQVTSYLDRNGIWNASNQISSVLDHQTYWWGFKNRSTEMTGANLVNTYKPDFQKTNLAYGWINDRLVKTGAAFKKSGLLLVKHVWIGFGPKAHIVKTTAGSGEFDSYWNSCISFNLTISTPTGKIVKRLGYGDVGDYHLSKSNLHFEDFNTTDVMFVKRGETPTWDTYFSVSGTHGIGTYFNFQMEKMGAQGSEPIIDDWDVEEIINTTTTFDADTFKKIDSAGWYKVKSLQVY